MVGNESKGERNPCFVMGNNKQVSFEADDFTRLFQLCDLCKLGLYFGI